MLQFSHLQNAEGMYYVRSFRRIAPYLIFIVGVLYVTFQIIGVPGLRSYPNQEGRIILRSLQKLEEKRNVSNYPLLILFTTWSSLNENPYICRNTLKTWASLKPYVHPVVFTDVQEISAMANAAGWYTLPLGKTSCGGVPILREMFKTIFEFTHIELAAYANSDILFNPGLTDSVISILENLDIKKDQILMIGKRIDVFIDKKKNKEVTNAGDVDNLLSGSRFAWDYAADYFITNRKFPWKEVPDLVVGRPLIDNWLVDFARKKAVKIIDATSTINAIHQTTEERKQTTSQCNKDLLIKRKLLPRFPISFGQIVCATYQTIFSYNSKVQIIPKKFVTYECEQKDSAAGLPIPLR